MVAVETDGFNPMVEPLGVQGNVVGDKNFSVLNLINGVNKGLSGLASVGCSRDRDIGKGMAGWTDDVDWGKILETGVKSGTDILKWRYGPPPPGTTVQAGPYGPSVYTGDYGGFSPNVNANINAGIGGINIMPILIIAGIGLIAVKIMKSM